LNFFENPYPAQHALRDAGPVVFLEKWNVYGVARYAEVHAVLNDPLTFCSSRGVGLSDFKKDKPWRPPSLILEADPPAHTRTRAVLSKVLSPSVMKQARDRFAAAAVAKIDELLERRSFDAIPELAEAYPLSVFPDAMGLKQEGREHLLAYAGVVFNAFGPPNELRRTAIERSAPHQAYVAEQCQRENLAPGGFGAGVHAFVDSGEITEQEAPLLVRSLLSAGLDTTVNGIGAAVYCLARFPEALRRLRDDPSLARNAFEEALRFESPVQTFFRTTTREVDIDGYSVGEGEKVLMFLGAANRDPRRWENPDWYDVSRRTSGHVAFGSGIHMCVGQLVARLEGELILSALARKVAAIQITGPVKRRYNNTLRGLDSLPVTITPA
jgi:cytochrome P450